MPTSVDIKGIVWHPELNHARMCEVLAVQTGEGSQVAVANHLGVDKRVYHRGWFTGPTSLSKIGLWANSVGLDLRIRDGVAEVVSPT